MALHDLFPPIEPHATGFLKVDDIHTLYWEECGNPSGIPVVFLHGGPGAGCSSFHRRFFDPADWRIILFDQRGCGRSKPRFETRNNTTDLLVEDIEALRRDRRIEKWHVFGGSWGSTLALAYAETHPERCLGLILRGICLMQKYEVDWFLYGMKTFFPESWEEFSNFIPPQERHDLLSAYLKILSGHNEDLRRKAVQRWHQYEVSCLSLLPSQKTTEDEDNNSALPLMEAHYFKNNLFTPDSKLLDNINRIRGIPAIIVQGRYDTVCPIVTANELHKRWPEADYRIIPDAGHSTLEPGICSALVESTEKFKKLT